MLENTASATKIPTVRFFDATVAAPPLLKPAISVKTRLFDIPLTSGFEVNRTARKWREGVWSLAREGRVMNDQFGRLSAVAPLRHPDESKS